MFALSEDLKGLTSLSKQVFRTAQGLVEPSQLALEETGLEDAGGHLHFGRLFGVVHHFCQTKLFIDPPKNLNTSCKPTLHGGLTQVSRQDTDGGTSAHILKHAKGCTMAVLFMEAA